MLCKQCNQNPAFVHPAFGILACEECRGIQAILPKPGKQTEFTSQDIKEQRKAYSDDILQTHNRGQLSKEYLDRYGVQAVKRRGFSDKEIKNAKYVWNDDKYYKEH